MESSTPRNYWLDLFSGTTWKEFLNSGADVSGFRSTRWNVLKKVSVGDYLICYLTGISRFIGILEVTSSPYQDESPIWNDDAFPARVKVRALAILTPETAVPVEDVLNKLSFYKTIKGPNAWTGYFRASPMLWKCEDGKTVCDAIGAARANPVIRQVDRRKLAKRPQGLTSKKIGVVSIPDDNETNHRTDQAYIDEKTVPGEEKPVEIRKHTEIEYILLSLGQDMGFGVWVARNDRSREYFGKKFSEIFPLQDKLPLQFDEATLRTVELIDVLWLKGNMIVAAFEVESTTSIYSGLLRMADLLSMQPNINIPLYLVAPEERRRKVIDEVNRPTFSRLNPPLSHVCRYITFENLVDSVGKVKGVVKYLKPEFINGISEDCGM